MRWTPSPPTTEGWYWIKFANKDPTPQVAHCYPQKDDVYVVGVCDWFYLDEIQLWSDSPIPEPEGEAKP